MEEVSKYFNNATYYSFNGPRVDFNQFMADNNASHTTLVVMDTIYFITNVEDISFLQSDLRVTTFNGSGG